MACISSVTGGLASSALGALGLMVEVPYVADADTLAFIDERLLLNRAVLRKLLGGCLEVTRVASGFKQTHYYHFLRL